MAVRVRTTAVRVRTIANKGSLGLHTAQPRYFSIASSPRHHGSVAHMTVAVVRYRSRVFQARAPHPHSHAHPHARAHAQTRARRRMRTRARAQTHAPTCALTQHPAHACTHTHVLAHVHARTCPRARAPHVHALARTHPRNAHSVLSTHTRAPTARASRQRQPDHGGSQAALWLALVSGAVRPHCACRR